ncbi:MAG: hypothetical protein IT514_13110 [Burkholderiales bacterium]|nr:hypothetical protein [Burkholderiales bacterium]
MMGMFAVADPRARASLNSRAGSLRGTAFLRTTIGPSPPGGTPLARSRGRTHEEEERSLGELVRLSGGGSGAMQRELGRVAAAGLLSERRVGNQWRFRAARATRRPSAALRRLQAILDGGEALLTHNYVLVEASALLQARLGVEAAAGLARDSAAFVIEWVDEELHAAGARELERSRRRQLSLVDHISFLVMRRREVARAFAFDPDFVDAGFRLVEG